MEQAKNTLRSVLNYFNRDEVSVPKDIYESVASALKEVDGTIQTDCMELKTKTNHEPGPRSCEVRKQTPFEELIQEDISNNNIQLQRAKGDLRIAGDIVLGHSRGKLEPDEQHRLEKLLVKIYRSLKNTAI